MGLQSDNQRKWPFGIAISALIWSGVVVALTIGLIEFSGKPGNEASPPTIWPPNAKLFLAHDRPTLVMFAHPRCPCTRASISELDVLMARCQGQLRANVVFIHPDGVSEDWVDTDLKLSAANIPGVEVIIDSGAVLARQFQCQTSGTTLLWDPDGSLLFQGGITISRGHSGDNPGRNAIESWVKDVQLADVKSPVFGCSLFDAQCLPGSSP